MTEVTKSYLFALILFVYLAIFCCASAKQWLHSIALDKENHYQVKWWYDVNFIEFKVEVKTTGYVGFGLSKTGAMAGSDIVTGWVDNGKVFFQDRHGEGNFMPQIDESQDWELISGSENDTYTILEFRRKLQTCDEDHDLEIDESTVRLIYAYSENDPPNQDPNKIAYHGTNAGSRSVILLQSSIKSEATTIGLPYWDVLSPNYTITSNVTSMYWCSITKGPELEAKHHIVKIEPVIQPGHESFVHHMVLWECVSGTPETLEHLSDFEGHECYHPNMPDSMQQCKGMFSAWGVGGEAMVLPKHVGISLKSSPPNYYMLEVHYDNPSRAEVIKDHSGLRIYYTENLRKYDAGMLMIGAAVSPRVIIPPQREKFIVAGHGHPECFNSTMPTEGIKLLGIFLHSHLLGRQMAARHFRGNKELRPLANNTNYDFNYQEFLYFNEEIEILPEDQITIECTYNSMTRNSTTVGGLTTREEMCLAFILYYPLIQRYGAVSVVDEQVLLEVIGQESNVPENPMERRMRFLSLDWSALDKDLVERRTRFSEHDAYCYMGSYIEMVSTSVSYPVNLEPYQKMSPVCTSASTTANKNNYFLSFKQFPVVIGLLLLLRRC